MVNWTDSPGYKLAKHLNTTLSDILLPNAFNIQNTNTLAHTLKFAIYRKPTTTDLIIHKDSCHPHEHKKSAINFLVNGMN